MLCLSKVHFTKERIVKHLETHKWTVKHYEEEYGAPDIQQPRLGSGDRAHDHAVVEERAHPDHVAVEERAHPDHAEVEERAHPDPAAVEEREPKDGLSQSSGAVLNLNQDSISQPPYIAKKSVPRQDWKTFARSIPAFNYQPPWKDTAGISTVVI